MSGVGIPKRLYISVFLLIAFVAGGMVYTLDEVRDISAAYARVLPLPGAMRLEATLAHIKLEEVIIGDTGENEKDIWTFMDQVETQVNELLAAQDGTSDSFVRDIIHSSEYQQHVIHIQAGLRAMREIAKERLAAPGMSGFGSESDVRFDKAFDSFIKHATHVEILLQQALDEHLASFQRTQISLIVGCLILAFVAGWVFIRVERRRRRDYLALMQAEKRAALLLDSAAEGIYGIDLEGMCIFANTACSQLTGYDSVDELSDRNIHELIHHSHPDGSPYPRNECRICQALRKKEGMHVDDEVFWHKDGTSFPAEYWSYPIFSDEKLIGAVVTFFDISDRKRQERLQVAQREVLEHIASASGSLDETFSGLVHLAEDQCPGVLASFVLLDKTHQRIEKIIAPQMPEEYNKAVAGEKIGMKGSPCAAAAYGRQHVIVENFSTDVNWAGSRKLAGRCGVNACWAQPIISADGNVFGTFTMYHEKPRKPDENELRLIETIAHLASIAIERRQVEDEKNRLFAAVNHAAESIAVTGPDTVLEYVNPAFETMTGYCTDEVIGKSSSLLRNSAHDDAFYDSMIEQVNSGQSWVGEVCIRRKDGEKRWMQRTLAPVLGANEEVINHITVDRDITDEKVMNERMEHVQRLESLGVLAGGIAHDFNNILTAIMGNAALARSKLGDLSPAGMHLHRIEESSKRAADLCRQMLAYSGKGKFIVKPLSLTALVEEIIKLLEISIAKNVVMRFHLSGQIPAVDVDVAQMQQVVMNLVINASEAIGSKSGVISISTGVMHADTDYLAGTYVNEDLPEGRYVYLEVADTGCGMDEVAKRKLFDPFFTTKFTGRGLGMSAVLGIVRGHGGAIKVYTEPGQGTTFKVLLPISDDQVEPLLSREWDVGDWRGTGAVLIVDDEETIRETAAMMLEKIGFTTLCANDGDEGVKMYRKHKDEITAVLLDMTMPKMDGKTAFRELRRINPDVNVVLSSGYNEQDATNRFAGQGLAGFIQKPYTPEHLQAKMREALGDMHIAEESGDHNT